MSLRKEYFNEEPILKIVLLAVVSLIVLYLMGYEIGKAVYYLYH